MNYIKNSDKYIEYIREKYNNYFLTIEKNDNFEKVEYKSDLKVIDLTNIVSVCKLLIKFGDNEQVYNNIIAKNLDMNNKEKWPFPFMYYTINISFYIISYNLSDKKLCNFYNDDYVISDLMMISNKLCMFKDIYKIDDVHNTIILFYNNVSMYEKYIKLLDFVEVNSLLNAKHCFISLIENLIKYNLKLIKCEDTEEFITNMITDRKVSLTFILMIKYLLHFDEIEVIKDHLHIISNILYNVYLATEIKVIRTIIYPILKILHIKIVLLVENGICFTKPPKGDITMVMSKTDEYFCKSVCIKCLCGKETKLRCSKCKKMYYCTLECQRNDYGYHKKICKS
jgi:hypothetical protein